MVRPGELLSIGTGAGGLDGRRIQWHLADQHGRNPLQVSLVELEWLYN
jgi:hypothetical protein